VDFTSQRRTPKVSAGFYIAVIAQPGATLWAGVDWED
jgi:hypothetical protein